MGNAWRWLGGIIVPATALAATADPGVTANSILLGQSAAFTGPAQELGIEMRAGAMAYFQAVNAAGGGNGRKIELRSLDDGYEGDRAAAPTKKLIAARAILLFWDVRAPSP